MATTIIAGFDQLKRNLAITDLQFETVSTRQSSVRSVISNHLTVLDSFITGSYRRSTMIAPLKGADIDIFVVLDPSYYETSGQAKLLDKVKNALLKTYTQTPHISRNGQAVTINFKDFDVDVVPAFRREGGGFFIPDSANGKWIATDPREHVSYLAGQNNMHNGNLVPLIKMLKAWNKVANKPLRSFYLEMLTANILTNVTINSFSSGCRYVFDHARTQVRYTLSDPSGYGGYINPFYGLTVNEAVSRFETAYSRAVKAEDYANRGYISNAYDEWRKIFGDYFPAYG